MASDLTPEELAELRKLLAHQLPAAADRPHAEAGRAMGLHLEPELSMSTIDELQRLHEAATHSDLRFHDWVEQADKSWPAIHRVLVAAREVAANTADDIDERLRYVEVRPGRDEWREMVEALRALDDKEQRT